MLRRGRHSLPSLFPLLLIVLFSTAASAASAVLGIDIGTEYIKAAIVKHGAPRDIVLTKDSKRKEAATLAFKPSRSSADPEDLPERLYGGDAVALSARFPGDVYPNLKPLLGVGISDEAVVRYGQRYPGLTVSGSERGENGQNSVGLKSETLGAREEPFLVEELLAMELKNIRANAEAAAAKGVTIADAVITYPAFYTADEKRAVELAADLAGLRLLGTMTDGLAVGLDYAATRTFSTAADGGKPDFHLVYDMGAGSTTATVLKFQSRTVKDVGKFNKTIQEVQVMGTAWDRSLGGDALNHLILDDMIAKFVDSKKMQALNVPATHVQQHGKTVAKLWKESERMRQMLSANTETSASFEGLFYEDMSFKYKLSRADLEAFATQYADRVREPIIRALESAQLTVSDLESIILHGGVTRTPFVQKQIEAAAGDSKKIRTNVNADESACLGAAFKGATISPAFRLNKEIRTYDTPGFGIRLQWTADGKERSQKLFTASSTIGAEKQMSFKNQEDFSILFAQSIDGRDVPVTEVKTLNLTASIAKLKDTKGCAPANISTSFTMRLSQLDGLPEVVQASSSCKLDTVKEGGIVDGVKGLFGLKSKDDSNQQPLQADDAESFPASPDADGGSESSGESSASASTSTSDSTKSTSTGSAAASKKSAKSSGPQTSNIPIALNTRPLGLGTPPSPTPMSQIQTRLTNFDQSDKARVRRAEALNTLESFTYRARDYLSDDSFITHTTSASRDDLSTKLEAASEWLYGEGSDAKTTEFKAKLKELKDIVEPALKRASEAKSRPGAIEKLREALKSQETIMEMVRGSIASDKEASESAAAASSSSLLADLESASSASESSDASSSTTTTTAADSSTTSDPSSSASDDLDSDPYASTSSSPSSSSTTTTPPAASFTPPSYTQADLESLTSSRDTIVSWLDERLSLQEKLGPTDDPAVLVRDLDAKAKTLTDEFQRLLMRTVTMPKGGASGEGKAKGKEKSSSSGKSKATKKAGKKSSSSAKKGGKKASSTTSSTTTETSASRKDEL
ncbi:MAG: hypothetical protein Q9160_006823 [Pyrenula sp. 1 TL-2023]